MERRSGKRSLSVGSEKMQRVAERYGQMERYCSTGQSPQRAVAPTEEEEDNCTVRSVGTVMCLSQLLLHMGNSVTCFSAERF